MKGADAVICAIGSSGFNPKGPKTVDYEVPRLMCSALCCIQSPCAVNLQFLPAYYREAVLLVD